MPQSEDRKGHGDGWVCALIAHRGKDKATQHVRKEVSSGLWKWLCQTNHTSSPLIQWYFPFKSQPASLDVCLIIEQGKTRAEACHCKVSLFDWSKIKIWAEVKPKNTRDHQQPNNRHFMIIPSSPLHTAHQLRRVGSMLWFSTVCVGHTLPLVVR